MKNICIVLLLLLCKQSNAQDSLLPQGSALSPLADYSVEWNKPEYAACNTAENAGYMSEKEKAVIYILNLVRSYPQLFVNTVLTRYPSLSGKVYLNNDQYYYHSLIKTMLTQARLPLLNADEKCFESAFCLAKTAGEAGDITHERKTNSCKTKQHFLGECCHYGNAGPLDIVLTLLVDENIPSLAHRKIMLGNYTRIAVSMQPHKTYGQNTVIDFYK